MSCVAPAELPGEEFCEESKSLYYGVDDPFDPISPDARPCFHVASPGQAGGMTRENNLPNAGKRKPA